MPTKTRGDKRRNERIVVLLGARCRRSSWVVHRVELHDLSQGGCCIEGAGSGLAEGQAVEIRIASLKSIAGTVRWLEEGRAGVSFDEPLDDRVVAQIGQTYAKTAPRVVRIGEPRLRE